MKKIFQIGFIMLSVMLGSLLISTTGLNPILSTAVAVLVGVGMETVKRYSDFGYSFVTVCGEISANIVSDCNNPLQAGTRDRAIIINFEDATIVYAADGQTIEDITLASGATAYYIDGKNNSIRPSMAMVDQTYAKMFDHTVSMIGFDISPDTKAQLNAMKDGKFIVVTENYYRGPSGNSAFEVYGATVGLELTAITRDANSAETQGAFDFTFSTKLNKEPRVPNAFFVTSYAATKTIVDALL